MALDWNRAQGIARFEFPVLMLFSTVGMMIMAGGVEPDDAVSGAGTDVPRAVRAGRVRPRRSAVIRGRLKYFVLSGLASGLLLYGISLVYGFSGTMDLGVAARAAGETRQRVGRAGSRDRVRAGRAGVQGVRRAVPYVDARCIRRLADARSQYSSQRPRRSQPWLCCCA